MGTAGQEKTPVVEIRDLTVTFPERNAESSTSQPAIRGLNMDLYPHRTTALFGPSGSGKSATARTMLGLLPPEARIQGSVRLDGLSLTELGERQWRRVRGSRIAAVFQEPHASLNPVASVGSQLNQVVALHTPAERPFRHRSMQLLEWVGLEPAQRFYRSYPHQLSGGQAQRALVAMALACEPELLIADEVTSALDAVTAAGIMRLLKQQQARAGFAMLLISHDVEMVREFADTVLPLENGIPGVETTPASLPREPAAAGPSATSSVPLLRLKGMSVRHRSASGTPVTAVRDVSLDLAQGETLALVGESGCGKSSLARAILGLVPFHSGELLLEGRTLPSGQAGGAERRALQMVFQDPYTTLNPRMTVRATLSEALACAPGSAEDVTALLAQVHLGAALLDRYPHQLSGGERQRVAIARALAVQPRILLLDEPMSALDSLTRRRLLQLLRELQQQQGLTYLMISHDLAAVRSAAHRTAVMRSGVLVETGLTEDLFLRPKHAYTRKLMGVESER